MAFLLGLALISGMQTILAANGKEAVKLHERHSEYSVTGHIQYLEDSNRDLGLPQVRDKFVAGEFIDAGDKAPTFGVTGSAYWFHFTVENLHPAENTWWLEFQEPVLDKIEIYLIRSNGKIEWHRFGDFYPLHERRVQIRNPLLILSLEPGDYLDMFVRVETFAVLNLPIKIWLPEAYPKHNSLIQLAYGVFYGGLAAIFLYNLMLFISLRDWNYFFYCGFVGLNAAYMFSSDGFGYEYIWPSNGYVNFAFALATSNLSAIFTLQFSRAFLRGKEVFPLLYKLMFGLMVIALSPWVLYWIGYKSAAVQLNSILYFFSILLVFSSGIIAFCRGVREAKYFLLAWVPFISGMVIFSLRFNGILPPSFLTTHAAHIGMLCESILLSFALADRMNILKEENERIEVEAKQTLELRVEERTHELDVAMQRLSAANELLKENSFNDGLTGVRNRAYFDEHYAREWSRSRREGKSLALLMIDIDYFKRINDEYGHLAGDHALIVLCEVIRVTINRPGDIVARYGGEEFVIILPNTDINGAGLIAERIRRNVEKRLISFNNLSFKLTVSIGCAATIPAQEDTDQNELIDCADKALYQAKEKGRNQVSMVA